jgi:Predicted transporter
MEAMASLIVIGILSSVFIFGLKTGAGCGFSKTGWKTVFVLCLLYFVISLIAGYFMDAIDVTSFMSSPLASAIHITLALFLLFGGIATMKKWHAGCDISNKTFLILVLPCPVCMSALLVSCVALSTVIELDGILIGALVGVVFVLSIVITTFVMKNLNKITKILKINFAGTPDTLGSIMVFIGLFYLIAAIMIPAYISAGAARSTSSVVFGTAELTILIGTLALVAFGALLTLAADKNHSQKNQKNIKTDKNK